VARDLPAAHDATGLHVYGLDWRPDSREFAVDGATCQAIDAAQAGSWPFRQPFFLVVNLAVGGMMGGDVPVDAPLPYRMTVDYVRLQDAQIIRGGNGPVPGAEGEPQGVIAIEARAVSRPTLIVLPGSSVATVIGISRPAELVVVCRT
jgi:beta-glucanase (GH16 family)